MGTPEQKKPPVGRAARFFAVGIGFGALFVAGCIYHYLADGTGNGFTDEMLVHGLIAAFLYLATLVCLGAALTIAVNEWKYDHGRFPWVIAITTAVVVAPCVIGIGVELVGSIAIIFKGG